MGRLITAFRIFFRALFNQPVAEQVERILSGTNLPAPPAAVEKPAAPVSPPPPKPSSPSDALVLLAALQREARLLDFLKEDLSGYADEQIGAAVREVHRDSAKVLDRFFALKPILAAPEESPVDLPADYDAARFRLSGKVAGAGPYHGTLRHHGWEAGKCEIPTYTGSPGGAKVVAPAEVEIG
jgi:hypothetical protein